MHKLTKVLQNTKEKQQATLAKMKEKSTKTGEQSSKTANKR
jgi:hypothetical protein